MASGTRSQYFLRSSGNSKRLPVESLKTASATTRNKRKKITKVSCVTTTTTTDHGGPSLPLEIITEILSRLPVKSLLQFRRVSKQWRNLISDTHFIKKHLLHMSTTTTDDDTFKRHRLIFNCSETIVFKGFNAYSVYALFNEQSVDDVIKLKYPLSKSFCIFKIVDACNGLICFDTLSNVHLWNPFTNDARNLPPVGCQRFKRRNHSAHSVVYGLGYDHSIDDYKVVSVCFSINTKETEVNVYTLNTKSWRRIGDFPYGSPRGEPGKFVSGALNWEVGYDDSSAGGGYPNSSWRITALDLERESYREIPQPIYGANVSHQSLGVLGGKLIITCQNHCSHADVWVMKEYGVMESWNKMFRIPYLTDVDVMSKGYHYKLLCYSKNGELLLRFCGSYFWYNSNDNAFRQVRHLDHFHHRDACLCVESLVSPNLKNTMRRNH